MAVLAIAGLRVFVPAIYLTTTIVAVGTVIMAVTAIAGLRVFVLAIYLTMTIAVAVTVTMAAIVIAGLQVIATVTKLIPILRCIVPYLPRVTTECSR